MNRKEKRNEQKNIRIAKLKELGNKLRIPTPTDDKGKPIIIHPRVPAYKRRGVELKSIPHSSENNARIDYTI